MIYSQASGSRQSSASHGAMTPHRTTERQKGKCIKEQTAQKEKSESVIQTELILFRQGLPSTLAESWILSTFAI